MSLRARLVALAVGLLVVGYAVASWRLFDLISGSQPRCGAGAGSPSRFDDTPAAFGTEGLPPEVGGLVDTKAYAMPSYEDVTVRSRDGGAELAAWWVPGPRPDSPAVVMAHGLGSCRRDPVMLLPAGMLHRNAFAVLLVDLRDQGDSPIHDGRFTGGARERDDVLGAWDWLRARGLPADRIGVFGESNGAATALLAAAAEPRVAAVWADSSYADPWTAVREEVRRRGVPEVLIPGAVLWGLVAGIDLDRARPIDAIMALKGRAVSLVHGAADTHFDPHHARDLAGALAAARSEPVAPWIVPGAEHLRESFVAAGEYERRLAAFFGAALGG